MALLNDDKDILPLSSIAELLNVQVRTLKKYEDKGLLPHMRAENTKKFYAVHDIKLIAFVHYLASIKKINANGIKYILKLLHNTMDEQNRNEFLNTAGQMTNATE